MIAKIKKIKSSHQTLFFSVFLGLLVLVVSGFLIFSNLRINQKRTELLGKIETLKKEIQILEEKNAVLKATISQSGQESYLEKVAREELNLKKPGEEVTVVLPPEENKKETPKEKSFWQKLLEKIGF